MARGAAYACKAEYGHAVRDIDEANRIDPDSTRALNRVESTQKLRPGDSLTFYCRSQQGSSVEDRNAGNVKVGRGTVAYVTFMGKILVTLDHQGTYVWATYEDVIWIDYARRWPDGEIMNSWVRLKEEQ